MVLIIIKGRRIAVAASLWLFFLTCLAIGGAIAQSNRVFIGRDFPGEGDIHRWINETIYIENELFQDGTMIYYNDPWDEECLHLPNPEPSEISAMNMGEALQDLDENSSPEIYGELIRGIQYASLAYCPGNTIEDWSCDKCNGPVFNTTDITLFSSERMSIFGYVGVQASHQAIVVAFRGTTSLKNFLNDFKFTMRTLPWYDANRNIRVHAGFYLSYASVSEQVRALVKALLLRYPDYRIDLFGHSFGGGLAVLCALDLKVNVLTGMDPSTRMTVITVGQPRIGNEFFCKYFRRHILPTDRVYRVVNYADGIPKLPPWSLGFRNHVREVWIQRDNKRAVFCSSVVGEDPCCSSSLFFSNHVYHLYAFNVSMSLLC